MGPSIEDPGGIVGTRVSVCERLCGGGVAPPQQEVDCIIVWGMWWNGILVLLRLRSFSVDFQWLVNISLRMGVLEEQDGTAVGVSWSLPSSPLINAHLRF